MFVLYMTVFASFHFVISELRMCPESIPTISIVSSCPSNAIEWMSAAKRKSCNQLGKIQTCTKTDTFVYHCVLNKQATLLLEVCAPVHFMSGYCARFSEEHIRIINDPGLDCTYFDPPCPTRFPSNESYRYPMCYRYATKKLENIKTSQQQKNKTSVVLSIGLLALFATTSITLLLIIFVGIKLKKIKFNVPCRKKSSSKGTDKFDDIDNEKCSTESLELLKGTGKDTEEGKCFKERTELLKENKETIKEKNEIKQERDFEVDEMLQYKTLSGDKQGSISSKGIKTVSGLRDKLVSELSIPRAFVFVVIGDKGTLCDDDTEIKTLSCPIELMIANQHRTKNIDDANVSNGDHNDEADDVDAADDNEDGDIDANADDDDSYVDVDDDDDEDEEDNESLEIDENEICCGYFKDPDTLFYWIGNKLLKEASTDLSCPKCSWFWDPDEFVADCKMSLDERIFFQEVLNVNMLKKTFDQVENLKKQNFDN